MNPATHDRSLFGTSVLPLMDEPDWAAPAAEVLAQALTHGERLPAYLAIESLAPRDRAIYAVATEMPDLRLCPPQAPAPANTEPIHVYLSSIGRLHLRAAPAPDGTELVRYRPLGVLHLPAHAVEATRLRHADWERREALAMARLRAELDHLDDAQATSLLEHVIDHVQHVESVCFYVGDDCLTKLDRVESLIDTKAGPGYLNSLRAVSHRQWDDKACLVTLSLRALFLSGRSVRFEEFNGLTLTASLLLATLQRLQSMYAACGLKPAHTLEDGLLAHAQAIRQISLRVQPPWLRYRWIYALNFLKTERMCEILHPAELAQDALTCFARTIDMPGVNAPAQGEDETAWFHRAGLAALRRSSEDLRDHPRAGAATTWFEWLIQEVVASAVQATHSDYGMSSSLRHLGALVDRSTEDASAHINTLSTKDFYTCFVSSGFSGRLPSEHALQIASSVQKRMMFNRWHFVPANLQDGDIDPGRHWYYQPVLPDLAEHSDMHREAHARAAVKYSIRSPGPDMGRAPLILGGLACRGFYDVRVVRMSGEPYDVDDMLRTRRRTLWIEGLFQALVEHIRSHDPLHRIEGFLPGHYLDLDTAVNSGVPTALPVAQP